jgi:hypothetical protein
METPRGADLNLDGETPGQEERELQAISGTPEEEDVINQIGITVDDTHEPLGGDDDAEAATRRSSRARSEEVARGRVVAVAANPYGELEDVCGVCLENPGADAMVSLWCCKNILCIFDARKLGACPFCREEPVVWNLRVAGSLS